PPPTLHSFPTRRSSDLADPHEDGIALAEAREADRGGLPARERPRGRHQGEALQRGARRALQALAARGHPEAPLHRDEALRGFGLERKSTRLNSSHDQNS